MGVRITDGGLSWTASIDDAELNRKANQIENRIGKMSSNAVGEVGKMDGAFNKLAYTLGGAFSIAVAAGFVKELTSVRGQFQQIEIAFTTMLKSKEKADQLMKEAIQLAAQTPFSLQDVAKGAKQLIAYGFEAKNITENLSKLGNIAAGVSAPLGDIVYLYGTLKTQGRAYTRDILQFTARGIPIIGELAKQFGVTESQVQKLVEAGKVGFPDIEKAFNNMTGAGGIFFNLMQEQSKSLTGQISNLGDAWDVMLNKIGKDNQGVLSGGIGIAADLVLNYEKVVEILGILITSYGVYKAAVIATAAFEKVSAASKFGVVVALNEESVARAVNSASLAEELRVTVSNLAVKKAAATESAVLAATELASARERLVVAELAQVKSLQSVVSSARVTAAKEVEIATNEVVAAQEKAGLTRKAALSASSEFYTAKTGLESAAKGANAAITVELTAAESLNAAGKRVLATAQAAYNTVLAASPMLAFTAVVTALGLVIYSLTQITNAAEESQKKLNEAKDEGIKTADKEQNSIEQLIGVIKSQTASVEQKKKAYDDLQKSTNGVLLAYSQEEIASGKATKSIDDYIIKIREATSARKAFSEYKELADQIDELDRKGVKAISTFKRVGYSLKNTFAPSGVGLKEYFQGLVSTDAANSTIVRQQKDSATKQMEALKKVYGDKFNEIITGIDDKSKNNPIKIRTVSVIDEEIKNKKEAQDATSSRKEYATIQSEINKLEAEKTAITGKLNKTEQKQSNERLAALKEIYQAEQEAKTKSLSKDQAEIKSAKDKYDVLRAEAKKAGLGSGSITRIDNIEKKVTGNIRYDQETEKLKASLDSQRKIYDDFENYKKEVGETKATERYSKELEIAKQIEDKAAKELAGLMTISAVGGSLSGNQQERLKVITDSYKKQYDIDQALKDKSLAEALNATKTFEEQKQAIEKKYSDLEVALPADENYIVRTKELEVQKAEEINTAKDAQIEKQKIFKEFYDGVDELSDQSARTVIDNAKKMLDALVKAGTISPDLAKKISKDLGDAGKAIDEKLPKRLASLSQELAGVANAVKPINEDFADVLGTVANVVGSVGEIKQSVIDLKSAQGKGDLLGGLTAGLSIAGTAFSLFSSFGDLLNKKNKDRIEEQRKEAEYTNSLQLKAIEAQTKAMERQLALIKDIYGADRILKYGEAIGDLKKKQEESAKSITGKLILTNESKGVDEALSAYNKGVGDDFLKTFAPTVFKRIQAGEFEKLSVSLKPTIDEIERLQKALDEGKLDETTAANVQSLITYTKQYQDTLNALNAETTGSTFDGITDSIVQMFANGTTAAEDFGKNFEDIMKKSILQSFKRNSLEKALQGYYDTFAEYSKSKGGLDNGEIDALRSQYNDIIANSQKQFDQLQQATGIDFSNSASTTSQNSLKGSIGQSITEETGTVVAGQLGGLRLAQLLTNDILKGQTVIQTNHLSVSQIMAASLSNIEKYTLRTADNTNRLEPIEQSLKSMNDKMDKNANALGGAGKI